MVIRIDRNFCKNFDRTEVINPFQVISIGTYDRKYGKTENGIYIITTDTDYCINLNFDTVEERDKKFECLAEDLNNALKDFARVI